VLDQNGQAIATAGMTPYEQGTFYDGSTLQHAPLGSPRNSSGQFNDNPNGYCQSLPLSKSLTATQTISVTLNGTEYTVRKQHITLTVPSGSAGFGHGTLKNDYPNTSSPDINVSR
jgi:hypothetical protein